jgi:hypothetical protein
MYAILEGIKYQNITSLADYNVNSSQYIYKNIKLTVCNSYKAMFITPLTIENISFDEIVKRIDDQKTVVDSLVVIDVKKRSNLTQSR